MATIGLIVEGIYDEAVYRVLLRRCRGGVNPVIRRCKGPVIGKCRGLVAELDRSYRPIEKVLVVADADGRNPEQLENELKRSLVESYRFKVIPIIVVQRLEAWLLADPQALRSAFGNSRDFNNPERIRDPKSELRSVAGSTRYTAQVAGRIAEQIDLKLLEQRCPRFALFRKAALAPSSKSRK